MNKDWNRNTILLILVAALGYFVDIYDLILFSVIRVKSLKAIGIPEHELLSVGTWLINAQMIGMLIGGILWGIWGDKRGRLKVLFASILTYSVANIANGLVTNVTQYAIVRFIAGVGLAGELGAGITLITETMSKKNRGYGTMIVATVGLLGAVVAAKVGESYQWNVAYFIGGGMGLILLLMRVGVLESGMYKKIAVEEDNVRKGDFLMLFNNKKRFFRYLNCILIAIPVWFVVGILVTFAPELGKAMGATDLLSAGKGIMYTYLGISVGDMLTGLLSQFFKTRKKIVIVFLVFTLISILVFLFSKRMNTYQYHVICFFMGISTGFWVIFVTIASEQFGTNLRATVTTTVPNFVRGSVPLINLYFMSLKGPLGIVNAALVVGLSTIAIALIAALNLQETFNKEIDFIET